MEFRIALTNWKVGLSNEDDSASKVIGGTYAVKCGPKTIAEKDFNIGYSCTKISLPASLMVKAEELDNEIRAAIETFFQK